MKHRIKHKNFNRNTNQLKALRRGLVSSLFENGRIETTLIKAKAVVPEVDKVMTLAKEGGVNSKRQVVKILGPNAPMEDIFVKVAPMTGDRKSGFTRIIKLGSRFSDGTEMAILELVDYQAPSLTPSNSEPVSKKEERSEPKKDVTPKTEKTKPERVQKPKGQNAQKIKAIGNK